MEITMLILTIVSTLVAVASFIVSLLVKKDTHQIRIENERHSLSVNKNNGVVADSIKGDISLNERKDH